LAISDAEDGGRNDHHKAASTVSAASSKPGGKMEAKVLVTGIEGSPFGGEHPGVYAISESHESLPSLRFEAKSDEGVVELVRQVFILMDKDVRAHTKITLYGEQDDEEVAVITFVEEEETLLRLSYPAHEVMLYPLM
jgi:predicted mannosyl-3-phosphoglycerate phosphatase (HAD superfamily)